MMTEIEFHADDYGLFIKQSERILRCRFEGALNAVSVMTNSASVPECMEALQELPGCKMAVHLNLVEGHCAAAPERVPKLVDGDGTFKVSFGKLLLAGVSPRRNQWRAQLREELSAQIDMLMPYLGDAPLLRLDGHVHFHMLPVVFDALMDVIHDRRLEVAYVRVPYEHVSLYIRHRNSLKGFRAINFLKVLVLNCLSVRNLVKYRSFFRTLERKVFMGVMLSGNMFYENVTALLSNAVKLAERKGWGLEILAHPGGIYEPEDIARLTNRDDVLFLTSEQRKREAEMFCKLGKQEIEKDDFVCNSLL